MTKVGILISILITLFARNLFANFVINENCINAYKNIVSLINNNQLSASYDGHTNCFLESGFGKAILTDFNYDTEPLPGLFPFPVFGPFSLLKETRINHIGKLLFKWFYWNVLLRDRISVFKGNMSLKGKKIN